MQQENLTRQQITQWAFLGAALMDPEGARDYIVKMVPAMFEDEQHPIC